MNTSSAPKLGGLAELRHHGDLNRQSPLPLLDHTILLLNPSYLKRIYPAAEFDLELGSDFEPAAESDSGWDSDLDSDSDASQPSSDAYTQDLQASLDLRHLEELYSDHFLLPQTNRTMGEPYQNVWWKPLIQRARQIRTEKEAKSTDGRFGSHEGVNKRMEERIATKANNDEISCGEWKKLTKPTTDETYGPPALGTMEPEGPPLLSSTASDLATEQMTSVEIPQASLTPNQIKAQRKKENRRERKAMGTRDKFSTTVIAQNIKPLDIALDQGKAQSSSNAPAQHDSPVDIALDEGNEALSRKATAQNDSPLNICLDEGNEALSSKAILQNDSPLETALDEGADASSSKATVQSDSPLEIALDEEADASSSKATVQSDAPLEIALDEEAEASSSKATVQSDSPLEISLGRENESSPSNFTAQNSVRISITIDTSNRKVSISALLNRQSGPNIDAADNQTTLPFDITLDTGTGERSITALLDEQIGQSIGVASNPSTDLTKNPSIGAASNQNTHLMETIHQEKKESAPIKALPDEKLDQNINTENKTQNPARRVFKPLSHNPGGKPSVIDLTAKTDSSVDFARKVAIPKGKHLDDLDNKRKEKPLVENLNGKENDHRMDLTSTQRKETSDITLTKEKEAKTPIKALYNKKNNQGIDTASNAHNHMLHAHGSSNNPPKGKTLTIDQTDQSDLSITVTGKNIAQNREPSESIIGEGKGKGPAENPTNKIPDQSIGTACKPTTKVVYLDQTLPIKEDGKAMIEDLADKMKAEGSNAASKETTHKGRGTEASHNKSQGKVQASNLTSEKTAQNIGSSSLLSTQHQPTSFPLRPPLASVDRARELKWAYITHTKADEALLEKGIWLFEKPQTYFEYQPYHYVRRGLGLDLAPIAVATYEEDDVHEPHEPSIDVDNVGVWINTHDVPWRDVRSKVTHPDFQPTPKLLEYQACESLGIAVWRHDRNLVNCRLQECKVKIADHNSSTVICLGCGPKTITRYCSVEHQIADLREHWEECGQPELLMKRVIDNTTSPARFGRLWPAIRDRSGYTSYERSRQAIYAAMEHGRYTLFDPETEVPTALIWPREDGRAAVMERRVERLLNYALFDHKHGRITGLLYRIIRQCLIEKNFWAIGPIHAVKTQFAAEFGCDVSKVAEQPLCECEWWGARLPSNRHVAGCKRLYLAYSAEYQATGIQGFLEMTESRFWALRAWRQRHPTVDDWEARVSGCGFAGEISGAAPFLGPGWAGWGSPADDLVD